MGDSSGPQTGCVSLNVILDRCLMGSSPGSQLESRDKLPEPLRVLFDNCLAVYDRVESRKLEECDEGYEFFLGMLLTPTGLLESVLIVDLREGVFSRSLVSEDWVDVPYVCKLPYLEDCVAGVLLVAVEDEEIDLYLVECDESLLLVAF